MADMIRTVLVEQKMQYEERIAQLINERDDARREVCRMLNGRAGWTAEEHASIRNWDCFNNKN